MLKMFPVVPGLLCVTLASFVTEIRTVCRSKNGFVTLRDIYPLPRDFSRDIKYSSRVYCSANT